MDIGSIDHWANNWDSFMHRASAPSKVFSAGLVIAAVILTRDFFILLTIYITVIAIIVLTRLPASKILLIDAYPGIFALLFAISRWDGTILTPATIILRALVAALAALMLITTTPYPAVFAVIHGLMPRLVGDGLFLTYRSVFVLLDLMGNLWTALKLRGGLSKGRYRRNLGNIAFGLGLLLVRALSLSEKMYEAMRVRGYSGRLTSPASWRRVTGYDATPLALGFLSLSLALAVRLYRDQVIIYNGYFLLLSVLALIFALTYTGLFPKGAPVRRGSWKR